MSLSNYDLAEIKQLYKERKDKILTFYLAKHLTDAGIQRLLDYNIITLNNFLTENGWAQIRQYIDVQEKPKSPSPEVMNDQPKDPDARKWWKLWS